MSSRHGSLLALCLAAVLSAGAAAPPELSTALAAQREAVAADPADPQGWNDLGNLLLLAGLPDEAAGAYERALEIAPELASASFNLGLLRLQRGLHRRAAPLFRAVVEGDPEHAWAWYQLGVVAERQGRERDAVAHYARAFALDRSLTFPDVNPQILDSELVTRALLRLPAGALAASEAPRAYERPERIAALLVPEAQQLTAAQPPPSASGGASEVVVTPSGAVVEATPARVAEEPVGRAGDAPLRVIDSGAIDVRQRGMGQATPHPGTAAEAPARTMRPAPRPRLPRADQGAYRPGTPSTGRTGLEQRR